MAMAGRAPGLTTAIDCGAAPRRSTPVAVFVPMVLAAACASPGGPDLAFRPPVAAFEVPGDVPAVASCLTAAYSADPFRLAVVRSGSAIVITAFGSPTARNPHRPRPRFSIRVDGAGPGRTRAELRAAWTLLGPAGEIERLRARSASCVHPPAPRLAAGT